MRIIALFAVILIASGLTAAQDEILKSYLQSGIIALQQGEYSKAETLFRSALSEIQNSSVSDETKMSATLVSLNGLAMALMNQQKYVEAESATRRQIQLLELSGKSENNSDYAVALNNLGLILSYRQQFSEAIGYHRRALAWREKHLDATDPDIAISLLNLGKVYFDQQKYAEAEAVLTRAISILVKIPVELQTDDNMLALATCDMNLSSIKVSQQKYKEAEEYLLISLTIRTRLQGADHPDLLEPLKNYAVLLRKTNRPRDAATVEARIARISAANSR